LKDELEYDKENSVEVTYLYKPSTELAILTGAKIEQEDDSSLPHEFTSDREVYIKLVYDMSSAAWF
jgi:hypothetical protein